MESLPIQEAVAPIPAMHNYGTTRDQGQDVDQAVKANFEQDQAVNKFWGQDCLLLGFKGHLKRGVVIFFVHGQCRHLR